jgi:polyhydroxybutyrate depolymerase
LTDNRWVHRKLLVLGCLVLGACAPSHSQATATLKLPPPAAKAADLFDPADVVTGIAGSAIVLRPELAEVTTTLPPDTQDVLVESDGALRSALVHTPEQPKYRGDTPLMPLVLALHGSDGSAADMEAFTGYDELADREHFVVAYADGLLVQGDGYTSRSWNSGDCCEPATSAGVNDVAFLSELLDRLIARYPVDPERVFVVGHSNGAIMAQVLGCRLADRIAGVASVAGALDDTQSCNPDRALPFLEIHGTYDQNVMWDAGQSGVSAWRSLDRCSDQSTQSTSGSVTTTSWEQCRGNATVEFISIDGAEHPWPSRRTPTNDELNVSFALDATEATWAFFSSVSPAQTASNPG